MTAYLHMWEDIDEFELSQLSPRSSVPFSLLHQAPVESDRRGDFYLLLHSVGAIHESFTLEELDINVVFHQNKTQRNFSGLSLEYKVTKL